MTKIGKRSGDRFPEEGNARLKRFVAESLLDQTALKDLLSRKW